MKVCCFIPSLAAVVADPQTSIGAPPSSHIDSFWIRGVNNNVVQNEVVIAIEFREPVPIGSAVERFVNPTCDCAEIKMAGLAGY